MGFDDLIRYPTSVYLTGLTSLACLLFSCSSPVPRSSFLIVIFFFTPPVSQTTCYPWARTSNQTVEHTLYTYPIMYSDTYFGSVFEGCLVGGSPAETQPRKNTTIFTTKKDQRTCKEKRNIGRSRMYAYRDGCGNGGNDGRVGIAGTE